MHNSEVINENQFSYTACYTTQMNDVKINSIIHFMFNDGEGITTLDGSMMDGSGSLKIVSRKVLFKYDKKDNNYFLTATNAIVQLEDDNNIDELKTRFPDFYLIKGAAINFSIYPLPQKGYLFTTLTIPAFYCTS